MDRKLNKNDHELLINFKLKDFNRIDRLINEISYMNNQAEYFRLKYYSNMILKIKILRELIK